MLFEVASACIDRHVLEPAVLAGWASAPTLPFGRTGWCRYHPVRQRTPTSRGPSWRRRRLVTNQARTTGAHRSGRYVVPTSRCVAGPVRRVCRPDRSSSGGQAEERRITPRPRLPGRVQHAALLRAMLGRIDRAEEEIGQLTRVIERLLAPYEEQLAQAESMPGLGRRAAQDALAETGVDMSRFATGARLASWAGRTPLDNQSGKRIGRAKSQKRQPVPGRTARRDRHRGRPHPDPGRRPLPAAGPSLRQAQSPGRPRQHRPPRRQARRPRLRSHPLPPPEPEPGGPASSQAA